MAYTINSTHINNYKKEKKNEMLQFWMLQGKLLYNLAPETAKVFILKSVLHF